MLKISLIAVATLMSAASPAQAADYYLVVPVKNRAVSESIAVSLNSHALPAGKAGVAYVGFNFNSLLQVSGDPAFTGAGVSWGVSQGSLPAGLALDSVSGQLAGSPKAATSGQSFEVTATYKTKAGRQTYSLAVANADVRSCKDYLARSAAAPSGWYDIDVDGAGPAPKRSFYCDMTSDGGGWTRVVRQTEASPVTDWNGGVNGSSYALAAEFLPPHTQVAFGKDEVATAIDYVNWTYTTGNIPRTAVTSPKTGQTFHVHRDTGLNYSDHDPESSHNNQESPWSNTLTFDRTGGYDYTWAFSPKVGQAGRGYALGGGRYYDDDAFAWTVWVR